MRYKAIEITKSEKTGNYYLISPINGTLRIFKNLELAYNYIDNCEAIDSHAEAVGRLS